MLHAEVRKQMFAHKHKLLELTLVNSDLSTYFIFKDVQEIIEFEIQVVLI